MTKKTLIQLRTNSNFSVNYDDLTLVPEVELIMLFTEPDYILNKKKEVEKGQKLSEFRVKTSTEGISHMIGALQNLQTQLQTLTNLSYGLNEFIKSATEKTKEEGEKK